MTGAWQTCDIHPARHRHARSSARVAPLLLVAALAAGCPAPSREASALPPLPRAVAASIDDGVRRAQSCESEIDGDLRTYVACIEDALAGFGRDPARRAGARFQAWIMADLATQQSSDGAAQARSRWWHDLQGDLTAARLTIDDLCARRGLDPADIRRRAATLPAR